MGVQERGGLEVSHSFTMNPNLKYFFFLGGGGEVNGGEGVSSK